jgi:hypothetical protein
MPYRKLIERRPDPEPQAAAELRRRVHRVRVMSVVGCTTPVVLVALATAVEVRGVPLGLLSLGVRVVVIFGSFAIIAAFVAGLLLSRHILRWRLDRWLDEVSAERGVPREDLGKYTTAWR